MNPGTASSTPQSSTRSERETEAVRQAAGELYERRVRVQRRRGLDPVAAREAVHEGTVRALSTKALPEVPTLAWFAAVDSSARPDEWRRAGRRRAAAGAITAYQVIVDTGELPARGAGAPDAGDQNELDHAPTARYVSAVKPRYLPAPPPHVETPVPGAAFEQEEHRRALAAEAHQELRALAQRAGVDANDLALAARRLGALRPVPWEQVAKGVARKEQVRRLVQSIIARLRRAAGDEADLAQMFARAAYHNDMKDEGVIP